MATEEWRKANQDKLRKYRRDWYERNKERQIKTQKPRQAAKREEIRKYLAEYLEKHPCIDCGESDIIVLDFDHFDPNTKKFNVGEVSRCYSIKGVQKEIDKCVVRCANCHRRKTAKERNYYKYEYKNLSV